jgi:hypothetical protein
MKKMKFLVIAMLGVTLANVSCKKDEVSPEPIANPTGDPTVNPSAQALGSFFQSNLNNKKQQFTIDAANPGTITGSQGTVINFSSNSFENQSGNVVSGNVDIELIEILSKAEMIQTNMPTMGNSSGGGLAPLISGGEFNITASQNGQELNLRDGFNYLVNVPAPNGVDPNMDLFYGSSAGDTVTWNPADSAIVFGQGNEYSAYFDSLNWVNLDYFMNQAGPQTTIQVEVPQGFNNQNCVLFISFDGLNSLAALYNATDNVFTSAPYYMLPVGMDVHFVAMSIINNEPHVAIVQTQITSNHYETIQQLTQTTTGQLATDLSNLP